MISNATYFVAMCDRKKEHMCCDENLSYGEVLLPAAGTYSVDQSASTWQIAYQTFRQLQTANIEVSMWMMYRKQVIIALAA